MAFPRVPKKSVSGKLKLVVREPSTEIEVTDESPSGQALGVEDLAGELQINLPKGFSMERDSSVVVAEQKKLAIKSLSNIRDKLKSCSSCRNKIKTTQVDLSEDLIADICKQANERKLVVTLSVGQLPNGVISVKASNGLEQLHFLVNTAFVEVGAYGANTLQEEAKVVYPSAKVTELISWLFKE